MSKRLLTLFATLTLATTVLAGLTAAPGPAAPEARSVESLAMFRAPKFTAHNRMPHTGAIEWILRQERVLLPGATPAEVEEAVRGFMQEWGKRNPVTSNDYLALRRGGCPGWLERPHGRVRWRQHRRARPGYARCCQLPAVPAFGLPSVKSPGDAAVTETAHRLARAGWHRIRACAVAWGPPRNAHQRPKARARHRFPR